MRGGVLAVVPQPDPEPVEDGVEPPEPPPPSYEIRWPASAATKVWMPKRTVDALVSRVKRRGRAVPVEIGRYCTPESGASDPVYANYHAACAAAMDGLLDPGRVIVEASAPLHAPAYGDPRAFPSPRARTRGSR